MEAVAESAAHVVESAAHVPKSASTHVAAVGMDCTRSSGNPEAAATADDEGGERTTTGSPEVAAGGFSMDEGLDRPPKKQRARVEEDTTYEGADGSVEWSSGLNADVMQLITQYWGGMDFDLFLGCVRRSLPQTHGTDKTFPNTMAIILSSHRLASAIKAGWGQRGCMLAAATGNIMIFEESKFTFGCTLESGLLEAAVRGSNTTIVEEILKQCVEQEFPMDKDAFALAVASGNADMVGSVGGYVSADEGVICDGLERAAKEGDLGMVKTLWEEFPDQVTKYQLLNTQ
ncbi:unnamed protein product [Ectocarpus sp. CCAP 1310/34]|nr:unnamed protein product [Ectocarpus sp. CCAP 1310/34]